MKKVQLGGPTWMVCSLLDILGIVLRSHEAWALEHTRQDNRNAVGQGGRQASQEGGGGASTRVVAV